MNSKEPIKTSSEISIVICSRGRHELLSKTIDNLKSILSQDKYLEIIVIEETNDPQPLLREKLKYYSIPERGRGLGFTRNTGLKRASGSLIVFIDDDILPDENWFGNLLEPFSDGNVGAVGGSVLPDLSHMNRVGKCISFLGFPAGGLGRYLRTKGQNSETNLLSTGNCAFRADVAKSVGGFDELLRNGEDTEFFSRISAISKTMFVPEAIVYHRQRNSLRGVFKWFIKRGRGDFLRDCKKTNPFLSLILPLRNNFLLKLFGIIFISLILASFSSASSLIFILLSYIIWNTILWKREKELHNPLNTSSFDDKLIQIKNAITSKDVIMMLPLVKFCMDSGREVGKSIAFFRYLNRRIFSKPIVLTFHHLNDRSQGIESANSKYYYSKEDFEQILEESEQEGRVNVSLSELINRLKNQPRTLYFEKILAVTFDDGSLSNYGILKDLISRNGYPFTIFVPTCCAGNTNKWDTEKGHRQETIMNWQQMRTLTNMGVEIGSHSSTHVNLAESPRMIKREELFGSLEDLNSNLSSDLMNGAIFSYPYGAYDQETIEMVKEAGYIGAVANYHGNIRPKTDPWQMPRYTVYSDSDWRSISRQSRSMWFKELIKDVRDWITGFGNN